jgi:hypothetical protein
MGIQVVFDAQDPRPLNNMFLHIAQFLDALHPYLLFVLIFGGCTKVFS